MGGFFGAVSRRDVTLDVFFGTDYHSHLGTKDAGMTIWSAENGFVRQIHSISNSPFRTKFEKDLPDFHAGTSGFGCISDSDPQPLLVRSHLGLYAITTVGQINNAEQLIDTYFSDHGHQFQAMSSGRVNCTELVAALINERDSFVEGIRHMQQIIDGAGVFASRVLESLPWELSLPFDPAALARAAQRVADPKTCVSLFVMLTAAPFALFLAFSMVRANIE